MRELVAKGLFLIVVAVFADPAYGLSESLREPKLFFPKDYNSERAKAVEQVLRSKQFRYVDGMTSYWPDKWPTTLVYEGNAESLNQFILALNQECKRRYSAADILDGPREGNRFVPAGGVVVGEIRPQRAEHNQHPDQPRS